MTKHFGVFRFNGFDFAGPLAKGREDRPASFNPTTNGHEGLFNNIGLIWPPISNCGYLYLDSEQNRDR